MADAMNKHKDADVMVNFASLRSAYDSTIETMNFPQVIDLAGSLANVGFLSGNFTRHTHLFSGVCRSAQSPLLPKVFPKIWPESWFWWPTRRTWRSSVRPLSVAWSQVVSKLATPAEWWTIFCIRSYTDLESELNHFWLSHIILINIPILSSTENMPPKLSLYL